MPRIRPRIDTVLGVTCSRAKKGTIRAANEAGADSVDAVRAFPSRLARFTPDARQTSLQTKKFLLENVYDSPELENGRLESTARLERMFLFLMEHPEKLPSFGDSAPVHRHVCDFIASMTDRVEGMRAGFLPLSACGPSCSASSWLQRSVSSPLDSA